MVILYIKSNLNSYNIIRLAARQLKNYHYVRFLNLYYARMLINVDFSVEIVLTKEYQSVIAFE